jgi:hypothetical protein
VLLPSFANTCWTLRPIINSFCIGFRLLQPLYVVNGSTSKDTQFLTPDEWRQ